MAAAADPKVHPAPESFQPPPNYSQQPGGQPYQPYGYYPQQPAVRQAPAGPIYQPGPPVVGMIIILALFLGHNCSEEKFALKE